MAKVQKRRKIWKCLFCLKEIDEDISTRECTESMFKSCSRYLLSKILGRFVDFEMFKTNHGPFCAICYQAAHQLSQKNEIFAVVEKEIKDFVTSLTDSILKNRISSVNIPFKYESDILILIQPKINDTEATEEADSVVHSDTIYDCYEEEVHDVEIVHDAAVEEQQCDSNANFEYECLAIMDEDAYARLPNNSSPIKTFLCECGISFGDIEVLKEHKVSCCANNNSENGKEEVAVIRFRCGTCGYLSKNMEELERHKLRHLKSYPCKKCDKKFPKKVELNKHIESMHRQPERKKGMEAKNNGERQCGQCGMILKTKTRLNYHVISKHTDEKPFECKHCQRKFKFRRFLNTHMQTHLKIKDYFCAEDGCGKSFPSPLHLKNHTRLEHSDDNLKCQHCSFKALTELQIERHNARFHDPSKNFVCKVCGIRVASFARLQTHETIHTGEKPFNCTICEESFRTSIQLRIHKNQVHSKGKFKCPHCDYKAGTQYKLDCHLFVHTDDRLFSCKYCDKKFKTQYNANEHQRNACKMKSK